MTCEIPYTETNGQPRPILPVTFKSGDIQVPAIGVVDSGADTILMPHLLGLQLGLKLPDEQEVLGQSHGIGGALHHLVRECELHLENSATKKCYEFNTCVHWVIPNEKQAKTKEKLEEEIKSLRNRAKTVEAHTPMGIKIKAQFEPKLKELHRLDTMINPVLLLGRAFFDFFEEITFTHGCPDDLNRRCFTYTVREGAPKQIRLL